MTSERDLLSPRRAVDADWHDIIAVDARSFALPAPLPDAEIAEVHRSGRQHDYTDTGAYHQQQPAGVDRRRRGGPRR